MIGFFFGWNIKSDLVGGWDGGVFLKLGICVCNGNG